MSFLSCSIEFVVGGGGGGEGWKRGVEKAILEEIRQQNSSNIKNTMEGKQYDKITTNA
jgi:hypothetical protein